MPRNKPPADSKPKSKKPASKRPAAKKRAETVAAAPPIEIHNHYWTGISITAIIRAANLNFSIAKVTAITVTLGAGLVGSSTPARVPIVAACLPAITANAWTTQTCIYGEPKLANR